ncbi:hypothetical protein DVH24_009325 [Malus domestica]|uniref:Uncharacterized protein n=1 Tax=Malus domestica TaxID=3750 RepID=A0A498ITJ0_MALDO|nr:hypothetical protein DVH24_009325 [Malus domestica]
MKGFTVRFMLFEDPSADTTSLSAKIGVLIEVKVMLPSLDVTTKKRIKWLVMKSFTVMDGSKQVVLMDILNPWFKKF